MESSVIEFLSNPSPYKDMLIIGLGVIVALVSCKIFMNKMTKETDKEQYNKFTSGDLNQRVSNSRDKK